MHGVFADKEIRCLDCDQFFTWTEGEQGFYAEKELTEPKRCKPCRDAKRASHERGARA